MAIWHQDSISLGEVEALGQAARLAWAEDTRPQHFAVVGVGAGQCFVSSRWLVDRLGGSVGVKEGHFVWLSPDETFIIDLTGDHRGKPVYTTSNSSYTVFPAVTTARTRRFARRADRIFESLDRILKIAEQIGDAYPGEEPERQALNDADAPSPGLHDEPAGVGDATYKFFYGDGQLEISPQHSHDELAAHAGVDLNYSGPMAVGYVSVLGGKATWEVQSNVNIKALERVFKDYGKQIGWQWGGITNIAGEPISSEFAPKRAKRILSYVYREGDLLLGPTTSADLSTRLAGIGDDDGRTLVGALVIDGDRCEVSPVHIGALEALHEWAADEGLTLYAGNDNIYKNLEDIDSFNNGRPDALEPNTQLFGPSPDEPPIREPAGLYKCPSCLRLFPKWEEFAEHRRSGHPDDREPVQDGQFPELDMDEVSPFEPHFTPQQRDGITTGAVMPSTFEEALRINPTTPRNGDFYLAYRNGHAVGYVKVIADKMVESQFLDESMRGPLYACVQKYADKQPADMIAGPIPFVYDVKDDKITIGHPGTRTADIPGKFTPGGIVEGVYEPGGKVYIRSATNMPFTVRHMVELWYYEEATKYLEVKSVHLRDDSGKDLRLASPARRVITAAIDNVASYHAFVELLNAGGSVFIVGGAVRDMVRGIDPQDIDMMVTKVQPTEVEAALKKSGRVDLTGKDFGVFRLRVGADDVEVALPRRERSTGEGHTDFEIQADHTMTPEEDLERRDFTVNAMAINMSNGDVIDPFGGRADLKSGVLRVINENSFRDDPLRIVRGLAAVSRFGLEPEEGTRAQMQTQAQALEHISPERIQAELDKLFGMDPKTGKWISAPDPAAAIRLAHETGVLGYILPEVEACFGYDQNNAWHSHELGDHLLHVLELTASITDDPDVRLAALLHDIGKPDSAWVDPETGHNHFYAKKLDDGSMIGADHQTVGAEMARERLAALRYPNARIARIAKLIEFHMYPAFTTTKGARRLLANVGDDAEALLIIRWADNGGKDEYKSTDDLSLAHERELIEQVREGKQATSQAELALDGHDLIALGISQGPRIGAVLRALTERVIDDPSLNDKDTLSELALREAADLRA